MPHFPIAITFGVLDKIPFSGVCIFLSLSNFYPTNQLTPWKSVLEKLTVFHLLNKLHALHAHKNSILFSSSNIFPRDKNCLRNISVNTLHKGDDDDDDKIGANETVSKSCTKHLSNIPTQQDIKELHKQPHCSLHTYFGKY
jgi:hypothetical protein